MNGRLAGDKVDYAVDDSGAKVLVVGSELMPSGRQDPQPAPGAETVIEVKPDGADDDENEAWLAASQSVSRTDDVSPDDVCLVMYSSAPPAGRRGSSSATPTWCPAR